MGVETRDSGTQITMEVIALMGTAPAIPPTVVVVVTATAVLHPMIADQHGDPIPGCPQDPPSSLVIISPMTAAGQMAATDTDLDRMIWTENALPLGLDLLDLMSTPIFRVTARRAADHREKTVPGKTVSLEKIVPEKIVPETTAEDETIEIVTVTVTVTGWITMIAPGARELAVAVGAPRETARGIESEIESRWTGMGIGTEISTADSERERESARRWISSYS